VDVLVNNAGFSWFGPSAELDTATFDALSPATCAPPTSWWRRSPGMVERVAHIISLDSNGRTGRLPARSVRGDKARSPR